MFTDRYAQPFFAENSITFFDTSLNYDSELFEDTVGLKLNSFDRSSFASAYEVDLGAGADWPAVAYEVLASLVPISAIIAVFFAGERVEKSATAWKRIVESLLVCIPNRGFTDANGAAVLALEGVFDRLGCSEVKLIAYTWLDAEMVFFDEPDKAKAMFETIAKLDAIEPRENQFGVGLHNTPTFLFKFETEGKQVLVAVKRRDVEIVVL